MGEGIGDGASGRLQLPEVGRALDYLKTFMGVGGSWERLWNTQIEYKPKLFPWGTFTTTISRKKILLARTWLTWTRASQAANLHHEHAHLIQRDKYGNDVLYSFKYLTNQVFRMEMELDAHKQELNFWKKWGGKPELEKWAEKFMTGYKIDHKYYWDILKALQAHWKTLGGI